MFWRSLLPKIRQPFALESDSLVSEMHSFRQFDAILSKKPILTIHYRNWLFCYGELIQSKSWRNSDRIWNLDMIFTVWKHTFFYEDNRSVRDFDLVYQMVDPIFIAENGLHLAWSTGCTDPELTKKSIKSWLIHSVVNGGRGIVEWVLA